MDQFLVELAKSGPWALTAGLLLWTVISAWKQDRAEVTQLLGEFKGAIIDLTKEIHRLAEIQDRLVNGGHKGTENGA